MQTVNTGIIKIFQVFQVAHITSDCTRRGHAGPIIIKHNTKLLGAERISITHCSTLYRLSILVAAPMCQLHAADCLILILNDICSVVSEAASCHYGAPMWTKQKPSIELTTEHINMMQAVRLTVQTCFIVQAQAQTGTFSIYVYLFNSRKLIVTQSCLETELLQLLLDCSRVKLATRDITWNE